MLQFHWLMWKKILAYQAHVLNQEWNHIDLLYLLESTQVSTVSSDVVYYSHYSHQHLYTTRLFCFDFIRPPTVPRSCKQFVRPYFFRNSRPLPLQFMIWPHLSIHFYFITHTINTQFISYNLIFCMTKPPPLCTVWFFCTPYFIEDISFPMHGFCFPVFLLFGHNSLPYDNTTAAKCILVKTTRTNSLKQYILLSNMGVTAGNFKICL